MTKCPPRPAFEVDLTNDLTVRLTYKTDRTSRAWCVRQDLPLLVCGEGKLVRVKRYLDVWLLQQPANVVMQ